jgi:predicted glutamine amidotransferase
MCVIAVKNSGVSFPEDALIKDMWDSNPHGAGLMYAKGGKVYIEKGFMKYEDLMRAVADLKKSIDVVNTPVVMHFRITTHGGTSPQNTHPFPISSDEKYLRALDLSCSVGMVHNGIINSVAVDKDSKMSDTMVYIQEVLTPLSMLNKAFYKNNYGKTLMENQIGWSKLAFLDKTGAIELVGDFKKGTKHNSSDILFSNLNHEMSRSNIYQSWDKNRTSTELLKPIPVGAFLEVQSELITQNIVEVKTPNLYFMDEIGIIYYLTQDKKALASTYYLNTFIKDDSGQLVELGFEDIKEKEKQYDTIIYGSSYAGMGGGTYDY